MEELLKKQKKIRFSCAGASHKNGASQCAIKTAVTMKSTVFMHATLRFNEDTLSNYLCTIGMDYAAWVYNWIPDM